MAAGFDAFSNRFDALALRLPKLGSDAGQLAGSNPVVLFAEQGALNAGLFDSPTGAGVPEQLKVGGERDLAGVSGPDREKFPGRLPEKFELGRVIFIIDRSGSMGDPLRAGIEQKKLEHIIERIEGLAEDYLPPSTRVSFISFDSVTEEMDLGDVRSGAIEKLKTNVSHLQPRGGTSFIEPLELCRRILKEDRRQAEVGGLKEEPRSLIFFLTDGHDSAGMARHDDRPAALMHKLGKMNASTFVVGIGKDYSMPRLIKLAGHAGASSWSHLPLDDKSVDVFDVQIPEMIQQILTCDNYFKFSAEGAYQDFAAVMPAIRFAPQKHRLIYPGYVNHAVGVIYEGAGQSGKDIDMQGELKLHLHAGRSVSDKDGYSYEIPIIDVADAVGKFEHVERAEDLNQRLLILRALLNRDVELLREMSRVNPSISGQLEEYIDQLNDPNVSHGGGSHDLYSSMSQTGYTSRSFSRPDARPKDNSLDTDKNVGKTMDAGFSAFYGGQSGNSAFGSGNLHSGNVGPLNSSESIDSLPPIREFNARAYDQAQPERSDCATLNFTKPNPRQVALEKLHEGQSYIIGRSQEHLDAQAIRIVGDDRLSRRHCQISFDGSLYLLEDLHSRNGTFVNDQQIPPGTKVELKQGDRIAILGGKISFVFKAPKV